MQYECSNYTRSDDLPLTSYATTTPWATNTLIINILNYYENTRDGLNNTDKLYIVVCLLYIFYNSKGLYLLFTSPYLWSSGSQTFCCVHPFLVFDTCQAPPPSFSD